MHKLSCNFQISVCKPWWVTIKHAFQCSSCVFTQQIFFSILEEYMLYKTLCFTERSLEKFITIRYRVWGKLYRTERQQNACETVRLRPSGIQSQLIQEHYGLSVGDKGLCHHKSMPEVDWRCRHVNQSYTCMQWKWEGPQYIKNSQLQQHLSRHWFKIICH